MDQQKKADSALDQNLFEQQGDPGKNNHKFNYQQQAKKITAIYLLFGFVWILASDRILNTLVSDNAVILEISIIKGWVYVFVTGALIYFLVYNYLRKISKTSDELASEIVERKSREHEIVYLSYHDILTGLFNRRFFEEQLERAGSGSLPVSLILWDINGLKIVNDIFGRQKGDELLKLFAREINDICARRGIVARWGGDEFVVLLPGVDNAETLDLCKAVTDRLSIIDSETKLPASIAYGVSTMTQPDDSIITMLKNAEDMLFRSKLTQTDSSRYYVIDSIRRSLYEKDIETEEHGERLKALSERLGKKVGLSRSEEKELEIFAVLHDIGKIAISDTVLNKPGKLTPEEWEKMKRHSEVGYRIVKSVPELSNVARYILAHHERWDGSGYPKGLSGEDIPLLARILAIVDAYDAMISDRPYRKAMAADEAVEELLAHAGSQFDPTICSIFVKKVLAEELRSK